MGKTPGLINVDDLGDLRPNQRDGTPEKGPLAYVKPVNFVMDAGAPRDALTDWRGTPSPASPTFKAGRPDVLNRSPKTEEQSVRTQPGIVGSERSKKTTDQ